MNKVLSNDVNLEKFGCCVVFWALAPFAPLVFEAWHVRPACQTTEASLGRVVYAVYPVSIQKVPFDLGILRGSVETVPSIQLNTCHICCCVSCCLVRVARLQLKACAAKCSF